MKLRKLSVVSLSIALAFFLIVGAPFLIRLFYSLAPSVRTYWSPADLLAYYGALLSAAVGVFTLYFTLRKDLLKLQADRRMQNESRLWQTINERFLQCLSDIHPHKLENLILSCLSGGDPCALIAKTVAFRVTVTTSVDGLICSVPNITDPSFRKLKDQLLSFQAKLLSITERYSLLQQNMILDRHRSCPISSPSPISFETFAHERAAISHEIQALYDTDYRELLMCSGNFFRAKNAEILGL